MVISLYCLFDFVYGFKNHKQTMIYFIPKQTYSDIIFKN